MLIEEAINSKLSTKRFKSRWGYWMVGTDGIQREIPHLMEKKIIDVDGWAIEDENLEMKLAKRGNKGKATSKNVGYPTGQYE